MRLVDDATASRYCCRQPRAYLLTRHRDIQMHRVPQWLFLCNFLHPYCRAMSKRINRIVFGHRRIAENGTPKTNVHRLHLCRDGNLYLLHGGAVGKRALLPGGRRNRSRHFKMMAFKLPNVAA